MGQPRQFRRILVSAIMMVVLAFQPLTAFAQTADSVAPPDGTPSAPTASSTSDTPGGSAQSQAPSQPADNGQAPTGSSPTAGSTATPVVTGSAGDTKTSDTPTASTSATKASPPKPNKNYRYNPSTGRWDSDEWTYNPASSKYEPTAKPTVSPPAEKAITSDKGSSDTKVVTEAGIKNILDSIATSGSATVSGNTVASNAMSGDASAIATIVNNINSSVTNGNNEKATTFMTDVVGDVNGDIMLKPMILKALLEAGANKTTQSSTQVQNTSSVSNDLNLSATSGNAGVVNNTTAGNATTGSANTVANVVNVVNSLIAANQSFIGTVNIYGNLNGDILIAPDFIPQLIASNGRPQDDSATPAKFTKVDTENTQQIVNNVNLNANSGNAIVHGNTSAGDATTGSASTNTVIFNMTGHEIIAKNSLLVFVNVLGKWVGVIVDAPTGATSAVLGNDVTKNSVTAPDMAITVGSDTLLTNNLNLNSRSGDATVSGNTLAGSAMSGNATASANIANISNSQLGLSDWFGILYINVFGNWFGSFGVDTEAGNSPVAVSGSTGHGSSQPIEFIPRGEKSVSIERVSSIIAGPSYVAQTGVYNDEAGGGAVVASSVQGASDYRAGTVMEPTVDSRQPGLDHRFVAALAITFLGGLTLLGSSFRKGNRLSGFSD